MVRTPGTSRADRTSASCVDIAHLNSCSSAWLSAPALQRMRLSNAEYSTRLRRHLRLPIPVCASLRSSAGGNEADMYGDFTLSVYQGGNEWTNLHNAQQHFIFKCAKQVGIPDVSKEARSVATSKHRPGDVRCGPRGHGWQRAYDKALYLDIVTVSAVCQTHAPACAAKKGGGAAEAAQRKMNACRTIIPATAYFQPLAFESEGYTSPEVFQLLKIWAKQWSEARNRPSSEAGRLMQVWRNELAHLQAKWLARCILSRAQKSFEAEANSSGASPDIRRPLASQVDLHFAR